MKYIEKNRLEEIVNFVNETLTPELKQELITLNSKFGIWFTGDIKSNMNLLNGYIHNEILILNNGENYQYNQLNDDSIGQSKFRLTYIKNHYEKEYIFLNFFKGLESFNKVLSLYLTPVKMNFNVIDLIQCPDNTEFLNQRYSIDNVDSGDLKKSKEIKTHLDFLIDKLGVQGTEHIFKMYIQNPDLQTIHNLLH